MERRIISLSCFLALACVAVTACGSGSSSDAPPFRCPRAFPGEGQIGSLNANPRSGSELVPGNPARLLLCRYWGLNGPRPRKLAAHRLLRETAKVDVYASVLDNLQQRPEGTYNCPEDEGARSLALFGYLAGEAPAVVEISLEGCGGAGNGRVPADDTGPRLGGMLEADLPYPKTG